MSQRIRYARSVGVIVGDRQIGTIMCPTKRGHDHVLFSAKTGLVLWRASSLTALKKFIAANWRA